MIRKRSRLPMSTSLSTRRQTRRGTSTDDNESIQLTETRTLRMVDPMNMGNCNDYEPMNMNDRSGYDETQDSEYVNLQKHQGPVMSWGDLQRIERSRREILRRSELSYSSVLISLEGTCLVGLSTDWLLWLTMMIFLLVRAEVWFLGALPSFASHLSRLNIDVIGGFLSFFLVLFVNQSNARFQEMYKESMTMVKRIHEVASIVRHVLPAAQGKRMVRYMNAAHAAAYVGLNNYTYTSENFFNILNKKYRWLTTMEWERIQHLELQSLQYQCRSPVACHELVEWCLEDVETAYQASLIKDKDYVALREKIMEFRQSVDTIYDYCDQPIHFFYIHFICLLSGLYLPLFAITQAFKAGSGDDRHLISDFLSGLIVFLQSIFVIGLRMLGRKMIDPYGSDLEDLSVLHYIKTTWHRSQDVFSTQYPGAVSSEVEEELSSKDSASPSQSRYSTQQRHIV